MIISYTGKYTVVPMLVNGTLHDIMIRSSRYIALYIARSTWVDRCQAGLRQWGLRGMYSFGRWETDAFMPYIDSGDVEQRNNDNRRIDPFTGEKGIC